MKLSSHSILFYFVFCTFQAYAIDVNLSGRVIDGKNDPLKNVVVNLSGSTLKDTTDDFGEWLLVLSQTSSLISSQSSEHSFLDLEYTKEQHFNFDLMGRRIYSNSKSIKDGIINKQTWKGVSSKLSKVTAEPESLGFSIDNEIFGKIQINSLVEGRLGDIQVVRVHPSANPNSSLSAVINPFISIIGSSHEIIFEYDQEMWQPIVFTVGGVQQETPSFGQKKYWATILNPEDSIVNLFLKKRQYISFLQIPDASFGVDLIDVNLTSSSGLVVEASSNTPLVCELDNLQIRTLTAGLCSITASQQGDTEYLPASDTSLSFKIYSYGALSFNSTNPGPQDASKGLIKNIQFNVTSNAPGVGQIHFTTSTPLICSINNDGSVLTLTGEAGTCVVIAGSEYSGDYVSQEFRVDGILSPGRLNGDGLPEKNYRTVKIGNQTWMGENLAYLPTVNKVTEYSTGYPRYYVYDYNGNNVANAKIYGVFEFGVMYNWPAAMAGSSSSLENPSGVKGVCPENWHLPSYSEWNTLLSFVGGASSAVTSLKSSTGWTGSFQDNFGFTAIPSGVYNGFSFAGRGEVTVWWTSSLWVANNAYDIPIRQSVITLNESSNLDIGYYVRCIKDF